MTIQIILLVAVIAGLIPLRFFIGKAQWAAYPGGRAGYLRDSTIDSIPYLIFAVAMLALGLTGNDDRRAIYGGIIAFVVLAIVWQAIPLTRAARTRLLHSRRRHA